MGESAARTFMGKVLIRGKIVLETALHIGGAQESIQIGGIDLPVIKDSATNLPYIPGSSLKGKLRSTLEKFGKRKIGEKVETLPSNRNIGRPGNDVFIHCCESAGYALNCEVCRLFGSSGDRSFARKGQRSDNFPALLAVRDCLLDNAFIESTDPLTELKIETGIDRASMAANPRKLERVLPGTFFRFELVYSVEAIRPGGEKDQAGKAAPAFPAQTLKTDLDNLLTCMEIIQQEGIGGCTSRGYGKVQFHLTDLVGLRLGYFQGKSAERKGRFEAGEFSIQEARAVIDDVVKFLQEEPGDAAAGQAKV